MFVPAPAIEYVIDLESIRDGSDHCFVYLSVN